MREQIKKYLVILLAVCFLLALTVGAASAQPYGPGPGHGGHGGHGHYYYDHHHHHHHHHYDHYYHGGYRPYRR
jgi:hypothetical protein